MAILPRSPVTDPSAPARARVVSGLEAVAALHEPWRRLAARVPRASLFASPPWLQAWMEVFGEGKELRALCAWHGGELSGVMPLIRSRIRRGPSMLVHHDVHPEDRPFLTRRGRLQFFPVRQLTIPGNLESGNIRSDPLLLPGAEDEVARLLIGALAGESDWDVVSLPALPRALADTMQRAAGGRGLFARRHDAQRTLYWSAVTPWEEYRSNRSRHFRSRFAVAQRKLASQGGVHASVASGGDESQRELQELFTLAGKSWKNRGRDGEAVCVPLTARSRRFYESLVANRSLGQVFPVVSLRLDGRLICGMLCAFWGTTLFTLQVYYDPAYARCSPGVQLLPALFDWCATNGIERVDWNGNSIFVERAAADADEYAGLYLFRPHVYSRLLHGLALFSDRSAARALSMVPSASRTIAEG